MSSLNFRISDFRVVDPPHRYTQSDLKAFLARMFARAAVADGDQPDQETSAALFCRLLERFGCSEESIGHRFSYTPDFGSAPTDWEVFDHDDPFTMGGWTARREAFLRFTASIFDDLYGPGVPQEPANILHVTCTTYESPSPAQALISRRGWTGTVATQLYHHGCHAAVPAIRVASGLVAGALAFGREGDAAVDVVHTELHTLHADPSRRTPDQIVGHTLFGDGVISYRVGLPARRGGRSLEILAIHEALIPETVDFMQWSIVPSGMHMVLSQAIPAAIGTAIAGFVSDLYERAGLEYYPGCSTEWAVHPGGPRILDVVRDSLGLSERDMRWSRSLLYTRGNLSSASLPHLWASMLNDSSIKAGQLITSVAFGPGLTAAGVLLRLIDES